MPEKMIAASTTVPALHFELTDCEPDIFTSKIGRTQYVPHGMTIPTDHTNPQTSDVYRMFGGGLGYQQISEEI